MCGGPGRREEAAHSFIPRASLPVLPGSSASTLFNSVLALLKNASNNSTYLRSSGLKEFNTDKALSTQAHVRCSVNMCRMANKEKPHTNID